MSQSTKNVFMDAVKTLIVSAFKLLTLALAYLCKLSGVILLKTGEFIEKMIVK